MSGLVRKAKPRKYRNVPTVVDGRRFDSKAEARRYVELKMLEKADKIDGLICQPTFELRVLDHSAKDKKIGTYRADFWYLSGKRGVIVVEDVKGLDTALSRWKRKHVEAQYGITVQLIRYRGRS